MSKKKPKDEVEELEQQIRDLKSVNRALMRRLKKVDRNYKDVIDEKDFENEYRKKAKEERAKRSCSHCERGEITEVNILGRVFGRCTVCDWRSGAKKKES